MRGDGLGLREPDGADRRVAEDHRGDLAVPDLRGGVLRPAEEPVREPAPRGDRDRREPIDAADITERVDA